VGRAAVARGDLSLPSRERPGPIEKVEQNILQELQYQSTLELDPRTLERMRGVPVASEIIVHARQELVKRLDGYELEYPELFANVIRFIERKVLPIVLRHAISGVAQINTEDPVLDDRWRWRCLSMCFLSADIMRSWISIVSTSRNASISRPG
jgi:hypothetical protein